jgi:hypothetical protein
MEQAAYEALACLARRRRTHGVRVNIVAPA